MSLFWLFVLGAAVGRATRLIVNDTILDGPRAKLHSWLSDPLVEAVSCPWCISGWFSLAAVVWASWAHDVPAPFLAWLAVWWISNSCYWLTEYLAARTIDSGEQPDPAEFWKDHQ